MKRFGYSPAIIIALYFFVASMCIHYNVSGRVAGTCAILLSVVFAISYRINLDRIEKLYKKIEWLDSKVKEREKDV